MASKHGNWHIALQEIDEAAALEITARPDIAAASWYDSINYNIDKDYYINGKKAALCGAEKAFVTEIRADGYEGDFPNNAQEIMLTSNAKELLGIAIGDLIAIDTPMGSLNYTVSGFKNDESAVFYDAIVTFMNQEAFAAACRLTGNKDSYPQYYIQFSKRANVKKAIAEIKEAYGLTDENIAENAAIMGLEGLSSNSYILGFYGIAAFLVLLVLTAGVLMISSSMNSNVAQRTQFYGMLRCVGASKKQIVSLVRLEALNWCKTAIPAGIGAAIATTWGLCAFLRLFIRGEFENMPLFSVSAIGILCGVAIGLITVLIAAQAPAKRAANASPIAAVSGSMDAPDAIRHGAWAYAGKIEIMLGIHHAVSSKKNLALMSLSFGVAIAMFLAFSSMLGFIEYALPSLRSYTPDVCITNTEGECTISRALLQEAQSRQGIKNVYGNMLQLHTPVLSDRTDEVDLVSYDSFMLNWSESNALIRGDLAKISGDSSYAFTIYNKSSLLRQGDKIQIGGEELEIAGELSTGIWSDGKATVICSEETFTRLTGKNKYSLLSVKFAKDATESDVSFLRSAAGEHSFIDYRESNRQNRATYWLFRILVYGFLGIIAIIAIFNIMNSISMSVSAKLKQYGAMRAIGMGSGQLTKMIGAETATYAILGSLIGIGTGIPIHKSFFELMVTSHFGDPWAFPFSAIGVILATVTLSCMAAVYSPAKRIRNMAVAEVISNE